MTPSGIYKARAVTRALADGIGPPYASASARSHPVATAGGRAGGRAERAGQPGRLAGGRASMRPTLASSRWLLLCCAILCAALLQPAAATAGAYARAPLSEVGMGGGVIRQPGKAPCPRRCALVRRCPSAAAVAPVLIRAAAPHKRALSRVVLSHSADFGADFGADNGEDACADNT